MMIDIDKTRYIKVKRDEVLALLERAGIAPVKLVVHRDLTYTARYPRGADNQFDAAETKLEMLDNRVAIFKRPSKKLDRGSYLTLKFAIADVKGLGISIGLNSNGNSKASAPKAEEGTIMILTRLVGISKNMHQLTTYAHELSSQYHTHRHLVTLMDEMQKQIEMLDDSLTQLLHPKQPNKPEL